MENSPISFDLFFFFDERNQQILPNIYVSPEYSSTIFLLKVFPDLLAVIREHIEIPQLLDMQLPNPPKDWLSKNNFAQLQLFNQLNYDEEFAVIILTGKKYLDFCNQLNRVQKIRSTYSQH